MLSFPIVTMPYSTLLHRRTRETLGLRIKGNVIIIDEAHNLVDAINNVRIVLVTYPVMDATLQ